MSKKNFAIAEEKKAILIVQVKSNQKSLLEECKTNCKLNKTVFEYASSLEKAHGRLEKRIYRVFDADLGYLKEDWPFIRKVIQVTRYREISSRNSITETTHYYVSNGGIKDDQFPKCIRNHWGIENQNHYVRDETLREDFTVKRKNPIIFAICISLALNIMRSKGDTNINKATYINSLNLENTLKRYYSLI